MSQPLVVLQDWIVAKFEASAKFCGGIPAKPVIVANGIHLSATFPEKPGKPNFQINLTVKNSWYTVWNGIVMEQNIPFRYMIPTYVWTDIGEDVWNVHSASELEVFLRKYAWLSMLYGHTPLFEKLLKSV